MDKLKELFKKIGKKLGLNIGTKKLPEAQFDMKGAVNEKEVVNEMKETLKKEKNNERKSEFKNTIKALADYEQNPQLFEFSDLMIKILEEKGINKNFAKNPEAKRQISSLCSDLITKNNIHNITKENISDVKRILDNKLTINENGGLSYKFYEISNEYKRRFDQIESFEIDENQNFYKKTEFSHGFFEDINNPEVFFHETINKYDKNGIEINRIEKNNPARKGKLYEIKEGTSYWPRNYIEQTEIRRETGKDIGTATVMVQDKYSENYAVKCDIDTRDISNLDLPGLSQLLANLRPAHKKMSELGYSEKSREEFEKTINEYGGYDRELTNEEKEQKRKETEACIKEYKNREQIKGAALENMYYGKQRDEKMEGKEM